jgi:DeoR family transcriptional regulator, aga operon transcriptional repressor
MSSIARDRRSRILDALLERRQILSSDLAQTLAVSEATIRRDLKSLADEGHAELVHGGARMPRDADHAFVTKVRRHGEAKAVIGMLAASLVKDDDLILLDSGSTCAAMVPHLGQRRGLRVILNSPRLAMELKGPQLILLGGQLRPDRMDTVGPLAHTTLGELRGYAAYIGADGLDMEVGPSASDIDSAHLHRLAVTNARESVLLVDHSKFAAAALFRIIDWSRIGTLVTDQAPPADWAAFLAQRGIRVLHP